MEEKNSVKDFILKVLTGMSIGIVVALVPGALLGELAKAFGLTQVLTITSMSNSLLSVAMGICIAKQFNLNPIQSGTLTIVTMISSGAISVTESGLVLKGIGDVINAGLIAGLTVVVIKMLGDNLKAYTILLVPTIVIITMSLLGMATLPVVAKITSLIANVIASMTSLQPVVMSVLIAMSFAIIIMSPISSVGVALAVSLSGVASGAANLGICAAGFGLAVAGLSSNGIGTSLAHFLGSPKIQMANFVKNPKIIIPIVANAGILGVGAAVFNIQGTPISAGFGFSGLIGPLAHLNATNYSLINIVITVFMFAILPILLGVIFKKIFVDKLNIVKEEDYKIKF